MLISLDVLKSKDPLMDLPAGYLDKISSSAVITEYKKGDAIFSIGDTDEMHAYLVLGEVTLEAEDQRVSILKHNHDRSAFALAKLKPRRYAARANVTGTLILWIDSALIEDSVSEFSDSQLPDKDTILIG